MRLTPLRRSLMRLKASYRFVQVLRQRRRVLCLAHDKRRPHRPLAVDLLAFDPARAPLAVLVIDSGDLVQARLAVRELAREAAAQALARAGVRLEVWAWLNAGRGRPLQLRRLTALPAAEGASQMPHRAA